MVEYSAEKVSVQELRALTKYLRGLEEGSPIPLVSLPLPGSKKQSKRVLDYFIIKGVIAHSQNGPYVLANKSKLSEIVSSGYEKSELPLSTSLAGVKITMPHYIEIAHSRLGSGFGFREELDHLEKLRARAKVGLIKIMFRCPGGIASDEIMKMLTHKGPYARRGDMYDRSAFSFYDEILRMLERDDLIIVDQGESATPTLFPNGSTICRLNTENEKRIIELVENYRRMQ